MYTSLFETKQEVSKTVAQTLKHFAMLCAQITLDVNKNLPITAEYLESFSRFTTLILRNNYNPKTEAYDQLAHKIKEYWQYNLASEKDVKRSCTYVQLYQMITMLQQNNNDNISEYTAHIAANVQRQNENIISAIKKEPGITFRSLRDSLKIHTDTLSEQLNNLENQRFIIARRNGEWRYYILTKLGDRLYRNLCTDTNNNWIDQWSSERIFTFNIILFYLQEKSKSILVQDIVHLVSLLSDKQVDNFYQHNIQKYTTPKNPKNNIIDMIIDYKDLKYVLQQHIHIDSSFDMKKKHISINNYTLEEQTKINNETMLLYKED